MHVYIHPCISQGISVYVYVYVYMHIYIYMHVHTYVCESAYSCLHAGMLMCLHRIYTYIYMSVHIYMSIRMLGLQEWQAVALVQALATLNPCSILLSRSSNSPRCKPTSCHAHTLPQANMELVQGVLYRLLSSSKGSLSGSMLVRGSVPAETALSERGTGFR